LALASVVQRFDMVLYDPSYTLEIKQTLTIKPKNFHIKAAARAGKSYSTSAITTQDHSTLAVGVTPDVIKDDAKHLYVAYGSNTGSCESFAQRIASAAQFKGKRCNSDCEVEVESFGLRL